MKQAKVAITRKEHFNAAHRLHNTKWSEAKNKEVFGKCNNPNFHGHNYELEVTIVGEVDENTGYVIDTKVLSNHIQKEIIDCLDHKNLNKEVEEFKTLNPTVENIAIVIYNKLRLVINNHLEIKIKLYETPRNFVEYPC
ncbi:MULTISPECIES: 6-pyruvoyl trahydropterin synthase family protein [Tenacibaculum]|uniref:6-carboxy-5,6,7,8-tetrahydropterin synthase n=2 Tax=Tenacibaculum TaxID=104267 RepID=A0ABM7CI02_9FLAO|nr:MULTISPECIES: 6-carboxytetrahydropterin synthase [Tenacibaculum]GFD71385.1 6-carboxy-5,6,7,8-tetrahydropterin synthase [Tenacibaculum sp. KUL113]GFD81445.1 6-carboxy-5,6,7,8-tetrahydropterin synthase [Tenacibaculum sp. KUL118]GFE00465.1 6-carboxy-5,6,7,8-tetrahydropterin synthase [Alteromonas sp. KUL156]AZJ33432.1 6-carboxytetrahydropterin synthase [Tenacibaculum mesophilum]KAF9659678.1 6-carboxytetrahydropterin synthase [Tenacibaculum mesophilum]